MTNTPSLPPSNYQWNGDTLSYTLDTTVTGLFLKYKKDGESNWITLHDDFHSAPSSVVLTADKGPKGIVVGMTSKGASEEWGPPSQENITNQPT